MSWQGESETESQLASAKQLDHEHGTSQIPGQTGPPGAAPHPITIGKRASFFGGKDLQVFTMTLGDETIELLPLKNWGQLDLYKWRVRGKLPGTPAGLEITPDHIKLLGQSVSPADANACAKLEQLFSDWLTLERETLELARKKAQTKTSAEGEASSLTEQPGLRFRVEVDKEEQVHIHCLQGKEVLQSIGLNVPGFQSLISQGFLRKPHIIKAGALHDWVELDGVLFSFEKGKNDAAALEKALNETYLPTGGSNSGTEVVIYSNAASSSGFDIKFPAKSAGVWESRRRPLAEESLELLQDPEHCGLLHKNLVIKLSRPTLIFKTKTPGGGEEYLPRRPENIVTVAADDGEEKTIDLSQPVNYLHLTALELTAVFNHPSISWRAKASAAVPSPAASLQKVPAVQRPASGPPVPAPGLPEAGEKKKAGMTVPAIPVPAARPAQVAAPLTVPLAAVQPPPAKPAALNLPLAAQPKLEPRSAADATPKPNAWLQPILEQQPIRFDWFSSLLYEQIATWGRNSQPGQLGETSCWYVSLGEADDLEDPAFTGLFLTEDRMLGFMGGGYKLLFEPTQVSISGAETLIQSREVHLVGMGIDAGQRMVFILSDGYRSRFGVAEPVLKEFLMALEERGAVVMGVKQALQSTDRLDVVWTVPAEQKDDAEPQGVESRRKGFLEDVAALPAAILPGEMQAGGQDTSAGLPVGP